MPTRTGRGARAIGWSALAAIAVAPLAACAGSGPAATPPTTTTTAPIVTTTVPIATTTTAP